MNISIVTRAIGKTGLLIRKFSPEIMLTAGVIGVVGATILACRATIKAKDIIDETNAMLDEAQEDALERDLPEKYRKKELFKIYANQSAKMVKIYAPSVALGGASLALIIGSHVVLNRRYIGTVAACKGLEEAFRAYRKRVSNILGEDKERDVYLNAERRDDIPEKTVNDETGETIITPTQGVIVNPKFGGSPYARWFDETSTEWKKNAEYNRWFLESQQKLANNYLRARGHLFLNEVYDMLGIPRSQAGAVVGWIDGEGDGYVDFGLYNCFKEGARDFINGFERSILLDFNVDGVIYDKI